MRRLRIALAVLIIWVAAGVASAGLSLELVDQVLYDYPWVVEILTEDDLAVVGRGFPYGDRYEIVRIDLMVLQDVPPMLQVASLAFADEVVSMNLTGPRLATVDSGNMLRVFDVSAPAAPVQLVEYLLPRYPSGVTISGNHVFVADGGLLVIDVSDPAAPSEVTWLVPPGWGVVSTLGVVGSRLFCGYSAFGNEWSGGGTYVFDITDPSDPREIAQLGTGLPTEFVLRDDRVFLTGMGGSIGRTGINAIAVDSGSTGVPFVVDSEPLYFGYDCCATAMTSLGNHVLASGNEVFVALDPSDVSTSEPVDLEPTWIESAASIGPYLLIADLGQGLRTFIDSTDAVIFVDGFESGDTTAW